MKRLISCIILAAALVGFATYAKLYFQHTADEVSGLVQQAQDCYTAQQYDEAAEYIRSAKAKWSGFAENTIFVDSPDMDLEITVTLARIEEYIQAQDDEVYPECAAAVNLLDNYSDRQRLVWANVL
ncbi:MAG: DUF4363 family protein [Eubacterium sp.]|nr:DUF4363 family protein [Eubacterium sp.]